MIRVMNKSDLSTIVELEKKLFTAPWSMEDFVYELNDNPYSKLFVMELDNRIIGYAGIWLIFEQAQITTIGIIDEMRGQGFGKLLLDYLEQEAIDNQCETISLEVRISNEHAINLYKKNGYQTINIRKSYYSDNHEDAYLMMKGI